MRFHRLLALLPLVLNACYAPQIMPGAQQCSDDKQCPEGLKCFPDNYCYPPNADPDCRDKCTGATPACDKTTLKCVGCLSDANCPAGYVCATNVKVCKPGCSAKHPGCADDAGSCDVDLGVCRGCLADGECTDPAQPRCDVGNGRCVACLPANDNCPADQYCDNANGRFTCTAGCKDKASCAAPDGGGQIECCKHACVDLQSDLENCGACGMACPLGNACCSGGCVDTKGDVNNCGGCGVVCKPRNAMGASCSAGACDYAQCLPGFADCDGNRANGCEVDTKSDVANCGACKSICPAPPNGMATCTNAVCAVAGCLPGFADCDMSFKNGCEIDTRSNLANCGACGKACPVPTNATAACVAGVCGIGICNTGFANCDGQAVNGCEVNTQNNAGNCGACGNVCTPGTNVTGVGCAAGACGVTTCRAGFADCDKQFANGCEINTQTNTNNCGACGTVCTPGPNVAGAACNGGACAVAGCNANFADCDKQFANGCEVNTQTNVGNCGVCGAVCTPGPNVATAACAAGACGVGSCNAGFADCDKLVGNGCEVSTQTNVNNCGACGAVCAPGANVTAVGCAAGACTITTCSTGYGNCDGTFTNGCESKLTSDWKNCNGCGRACAANQACINSACANVGTFIGQLGSTRFFKVAVMGTMTDTNVYAACKNAGLSVGCQAMGQCTYNDALCTQTPEASCGNPMQTLSMALCNTNPSGCAALYGVYQYMGHNWVADSACGAIANQWCVQGNTQSNQFALCVQ